MPTPKTNSKIVTPGPNSQTVRFPDRRVVKVPQGWALLPPGDAGLTRRVKAAGEHWVVQEKKGRRVYSRGVWAPQQTINRIRAELAKERDTDAYRKKQAAQHARRDRNQQAYVTEFTQAVYEYLAFHPRHSQQAQRLAQAVARHATPVGSGTVARTQRITVAQRAEAAVIAWMRHQTTGYDSLHIPRVKGKRREVRRMLAAHSKALLETYRRGETIPKTCPLRNALEKLPSPSADTNTSAKR